MSTDPLNLRNLLRLPPRIDDLPLAEHEAREVVKQSWEFQDGEHKFDFLRGRIVLNNQDLAYFISENLTHLSAHYWTNLAKKLDNYRKWALHHAQDPEKLAMLAALVQAFLAKIFGRIKKKFDETVDGVSFHLEEGQLLLNGINVNAFIRLAKKYPDNKRAKVFMKGLRGRLKLLLTNQWGNNEYEKIRDVIVGFIRLIDELLEEKSPGLYELPPTVLLKDLKKLR